MTKASETPPVHSHADPLGDGRMTAPAAERNIGPIVDALRDWVPARGSVLEIAAGTGQHALACARAFAGLDWQPTDVAPERLASIDAWRAAEGPDTLRPAAYLDATTPDWSWDPVDLVVLANLMHLISPDAATNLISGVARVLTPGGHFFLYGPFRTGPGYRSEGDARFDAAIRAAHPEAGYKELGWIEATAGAAGLARAALIEMPANNLALVLAKS